MHLYVYYLKQPFSQDFIQTLLSNLLQFDKTEITDLGLPGESRLRYEHRYLDPTEFNSELSIFCWENDFEARTGGKLRLGAALSRAIGDEVLVQHREDDPHEWVLINGDRFFVVPEQVGNNTGINLQRDQGHELKVP